MKLLKAIKIYSNSIVLMALFLQPLLIQANQAPLHHEFLQENYLQEQTIEVPGAFKTFVKQIIQNALQENRAHALCEGLLHCYEQIMQGATTLSLDDLLEAFPELIREFKVQIDNAKSARPDAPDISSFVGPSTCDLSSILSFLINLQNILIECCQDNQLCCEILQEDFNYTWTILANLGTVTAVVDFSSVFTVLNTINNEVLATLTTVNACCANITSEFSRPGLFLPI